MNEYLLETIRERNNPNARLKNISMETKEILTELNKEYKPKQTSEKDVTSKQKADKFNAVCILLYKEIFYLNSITDRSFYTIFL